MALPDKHAICNKFSKKYLPFSPIFPAALLPDGSNWPAKPKTLFREKLQLKISR